MIDRARVLVLAFAALFVAPACGGGAAQQQAPATSAAAAATLPAASTASSATLPPTSSATTLPPASSATTPTRTPGSSATTAPSGSQGTSSDMVAEGKVVYTTIGPSGKGCQECHGANARGSTATDGTASPSIVGATEVKLRNALAGSAALMTNLKLTDRQIDAVLAYLTYLDSQ